MGPVGSQPGQTRLALLHAGRGRRGSPTHPPTLAVAVPLLPTHPPSVQAHPHPPASVPPSHPPVRAHPHQVLDTSVSVEEYDTVKTALDNADRYYRVVLPDQALGSSLEGGGPGGAPPHGAAAAASTSPAAAAARSAAAFRQVALTWLASNMVAARFAGALAAGEVIFLGLLWHATGDLAAPMAAALVGSAVDFTAIQRQGLLRAARRQAKGPRGP